MKCPLCQVSLNISERQGIEIDYCPQCRGIWLDRGELDKIIQRSASEETHYESGRRYEDTRSQKPGTPYAPGYNQQDNYPYGYKKKKRKSLLEDLFDF